MLGCGLALSVGCANNIWTNKPPPVPVLPLDGVIELGVCMELVQPRPVILEQWVGEIDRYSEAIDKLRE